MFAPSCESRESKSHCGEDFFFVIFASLAFLNSTQTNEINYDIHLDNILFRYGILFNVSFPLSLKLEQMKTYQSFLAIIFFKYCGPSWKLLSANTPPILLHEASASRKDTLSL